VAKLNCQQLLRKGVKYVETNKNYSSKKWIYCF